MVKFNFFFRYCSPPLVILGSLKKSNNIDVDADFEKKQHILHLLVILKLVLSDLDK